MSKVVSYMSLGCKVNLYESVSVVNSFLENGFVEGSFDDICDVYIINTCTVTQTSDSKSKKMIRQAIKRNPDAIICVMGCFAQLNNEEIKKIEGINVLCGTSNRLRILPAVLEMINSGKKYFVDLTQTYNEICEFENLTIDHYDHKTRGFVKIQDGCENFCSYCAIPYSRGRFRSRDKESVIKEIQTLSDNGMKEIVLTGINTGAYGLDLDDITFPSLLEEIILRVKNLGRIRISSIEATEVTKELLDVMKKYENHFCMHLHIPIQGGSDEIIKMMHRKYDLAFYKEKIKLVRSYFPLINITADAMVGFNGETNDLFEKAKETIKEISYGEIHVFPYSMRPNTLAYNESKKIKFSDRIDNATKKFRVNELLMINEEKALEYREKFIGKELDLLVEEIKDGYAYGHSSNYLEIKIKDQNLHQNDMVKVELINAGYPVSEGRLIYVF
ncbi:MAG: tRNA (N(6)-L-threonylcarbamoyladenosine(37)-C(2))-methylthiotransferase MtaB [Bacilli bacterium]|nr:tRNA (N(6)-L-threonylcarbamoyladenosine(37)-C(2))-methylthiotransferase MtaB [Bacilli bacterium]